ncbi:ankyrin repeat-containing domain protein [Baffinella frigidus]|nr:ankyrin repeat-containing domain protein [Cryptophyta sp. CCMP2293]
MAREWGPGPGSLLLLLISLAHTAPLFSHDVVARHCHPALACLHREPSNGVIPPPGSLRPIKLGPLRGGGLAEDMGLQKRLFGDSRSSIVADRPLTKQDHELLGAVRKLPDEACATRVRDLLSKGAQAGCADPADFSYQPLHIAAIRDLAQTMEALVAGGADAEARARHGQCPLHLAAAAGSQEVVLWLLKMDTEESEVVAWLLKMGAQCDARDMSGWTPLHQAVHYGQEAIVKALLASGASVHLRTLEGFSARELVENLDETSVRDALSALLLPAEQKSAKDERDGGGFGRDHWAEAVAVGERLQRKKADETGAPKPHHASRQDHV